MTNIPNSLHSPFPILSDDVRKTRIAACSVGCGDCMGTGDCTSKHDQRHALHAIAGKSADLTGTVSEETVGALTGNDGSILMPEEQVLPTLNRDGKRKWINPAIEQGPKWNYRRWVAYALIAFFVVLPHLRIDGKPYVLIDIAISMTFFFFIVGAYGIESPG